MTYQQQVLTLLPWFTASDYFAAAVILFICVLFFSGEDD